jgi:2-keto-4-pentenoate hydratase/2-oxohepta-3-ene-1,7-dioic acid hydratase in catechol pathway
MKLVRFGPPGREKPGVVMGDGAVRDLSGRIGDFTPDFLAGDWRRAIDQALVDAPEHAADAAARFGVPLAGVSKIVGLGMNYHEGVRRAGMTMPTEPLLFIKSSTCLAGPSDPIRLPPGSEKLDWEVELGVVIARESSRLAPDQVADAILGYCVFNDLSERHWQNERGGEWCKGKSADGFGPCGPWIATREEIPDANKLDIWLSVNETRYQSSNTSDMIFPVEYAVGYISQFMRLLPGDIVIMGTPPGTGQRQTPQRFLRPGDRVTLGIAGLGEQHAEVVAG